MRCPPESDRGPQRIGASNAWVTPFLGEECVTLRTRYAANKLVLDIGGEGIKIYFAAFFG